MRAPQGRGGSGTRGSRTVYLAGAVDTAATLLESEGLLALILVSLVLTAWIGGQGQGWTLTGKPHATLTPTSHMDEDSRVCPRGPCQPPLPPGARAPPQCPVCHEQVN